MKTREEVARFVELQFDIAGKKGPAVGDLSGEYKCPLNKGDQWHYGLQDVRALLDFIYGGPPESQAQAVAGFGRAQPLS